MRLVENEPSNLHLFGLNITTFAMCDHDVIILINGSANHCNKCCNKLCHSREDTERYLQLLDLIAYYCFIPMLPTQSHRYFSIQSPGSSLGKLDALYINSKVVETFDTTFTSCMVIATLLEDLIQKNKEGIICRARGRADSRPFGMSTRLRSYCTFLAISKVGTTS